MAGADPVRCRAQRLSTPCPAPLVGAAPFGAGHEPGAGKPPVHPQAKEVNLSPATRHTTTRLAQAVVTATSLDEVKRHATRILTLCREEEAGEESMLVELALRAAEAEAWEACQQFGQRIPHDE